MKKKNFITLMFVVLFSAFLFCGCSTIREYENENHSYMRMFERMDSMMRSTSLWQQDFMSKQTSIFESLKQSEKNDSSYTVIVNERGDTVKERIVIYHEVERESSVEREEKEMLMQRLRQIDSLFQVQFEKQAETDSLLKQEKKVVEVPAKLNWWQKLRIILGNFVLMFAGCVVLYQIIKKRLWK